MSEQVVDFEVDVVAATSTRRSIADTMKAELAARRAAQAKTVPLSHDAIPELIITCRIPTNGEEIAELAQRADKRAKGSGTDSVWFNRLLIARLTTEIKWYDEVLQSDDGTKWTFASREVQAMVDAPDAALAVAGIFGSDAYIAVMASKLMDAGGFGNDAAVQVVDDPLTGR